MIQLLSVTNPDRLNFEFKQIYESSFPEDERRDWNQLLELFGNKQFSLNEIYHQARFLGFITFWDLEEFSFIEHFAIQTSEQGKGYGTLAINQVLSMNSKPVILEVEEPFMETARKRILFYERLNFSVNNQSYFQPPYSLDKNSVKMLLMSYPSEIETSDFERIKAQIHDSVYGFRV
jgi:hypothetical protein